MARLRNCDKTAEYYAETGSVGITRYMLRLLAHEHPELTLRVGRRLLFDLDRLDRYFSEPQPAPQPESGKIKRIG